MPPDFLQITSNMLLSSRRRRATRARNVHVLYTSALLVTLLVSCSPEGATENPSTLGTLNETLQVGATNEDAKTARLFGRISAIAADDTRNIYVADRQAREIRVFDPHGTFIDRFGKSGEGPGEFQAITAMMVDSNDRLIVVDPYTSRISVFNREGTLQESHTNPVANTARDISELPNGRYLLVGLHDDHLVHVVDADMQSVRAHLVPSSEALYTEDAIEEEMWLPRMPGHAAAFSNDRIVYAPAVYCGHLSIYERTGESSWERANTIEAYPMDRRPLTIVQDGDDAPFPAPDGRGLRFRSLTRGLFALSDDRAVHVFSRETEDGVTYLAGIVASDGTYEGPFKVSERSYEDHFSLSTNAVDANHNLYVADNQGSPFVRRMSIPEAK